jgi:hypothetical protein
VEVGLKFVCIGSRERGVVLSGGAAGQHEAKAKTRVGQPGEFDKPAAAERERGGNFRFHVVQSD